MVLVLTIGRYGAKLCLSISLMFLATIVGTSQVKAQETKVEIKEIDFVGNTVFSDDELADLLPSLSKPVSLERLFYLRKIVTDYYIKKGFVSSGAFIPPQKLNRGILSIQIIEGNLSKIELSGNKKLSRQYILNKLPELDRPLHIEDLAEKLKQLEEEESISRLKANLTSSSIGQNNLKLTIEEEKPFKSELAVTNGYSPSIGTLGGTLRANYHLFGVGDFFSLQYGRTEGLKRVSTGYTIPVGAGAIALGYTNADTEAIEEPISQLDIQADYEAVSLAMSQTIVKLGNSEIELGIEFESITSESFIDGDFSFAFVEGLEDGRSKINALRLSQVFSSQGENSIFIASSQFNVGMDIFDTTRNSINGIDGLYWSWQGRGQWLQNFSSFGLLTSLSLQLSPDRLLPLEQIAVGGINSVRGYRQNLLVADNGIVGTLELKYPVVDGGNNKIELIPFVDLAGIWNNSEESRLYNDFLASVGLGISYEFNDLIRARIDYGIPLVELDEELSSNSSGTQSINFLFSITP